MLPDYLKEAISHYIPHMEGWTTPERGCEMAEAIVETKPMICVDIGVFAGRSTVAMGFAVRHNKFGMVYGIDPWNPSVAEKGDDIAESSKWWKDKSNLSNIHIQAMMSIWAHRLDQWITIIRQESQYIPHLFSSGIGFLNIDGAHGEEASCRDVELYVPKVLIGGYVFMDDCDWPSTKKAVELLDSMCELVKDHGSSRTYRKR